MAEQREYHFTCGDSASGPIGFCATITADSAEEALKILKQELPEELMVKQGSTELPGKLDYIQVYFNDAAITLEDNDFDEEVGGDEEEE